MMFKSGRKAFEYYVANKDTYRELRSNTMARLMKDAGAVLEYDSNVIATSTPAWAERIETILDLKTMLDRHMTRKEHDIMLQCISRRNAVDGYRNLKQWRKRQQKEENTFKKLTKILAASDYISRTADESDSLFD